MSHFDFDAAVVAPFRMQPGLRRLGAGRPQLTPLAAGSRHQCAKLEVLSNSPGSVLVARAGFDPAPALAALARHAATEHPAAWSWDGRRASAHRLGVSVGDRGELEPLARGGCGRTWRCLQALPADWRLAATLSLAFAEDFAFVDAADGSVPWIAAALPSHWAPAAKVGRKLAEVHAPVADNMLLLRASDALVRLATGPERWERFVWNVSAYGGLDAHPERVGRDGWSTTPVERAWWRTERQTFIPLPEARQAVFTIAIEVERLADAIDTPGRAARLHAAIASMSAAVLDYRGLTTVRDALLDWLAARSLRA
jgi:hypothetical protein